MRHAHTQQETSEIVVLLRHMAAHLDLSTESWENAKDLAVTDLHQLTLEAINATEGDKHLDSAWFKLRAQELAIRLEIMEELLAQATTKQQELEDL